MRLYAKNLSALRVPAWLALAGLLLWMDYATGPAIQERTLFFGVVLLAAWFDGWWGLALALAMPLGRVVLLGMQEQTGWPNVNTAVNAGIHLVGLVLLALFVTRTRRQMEEIRKLQGLLPICSYCKKIRDQETHWHQIEAYITTHSDAQFSHGICPECLRLHFKEIADQVNSKSPENRDKNHSV